MPKLRPFIFRRLLSVMTSQRQLKLSCMQNSTERKYKLDTSFSFISFNATRTRVELLYGKVTSAFGSQL